MPQERWRTASGDRDAGRFTPPQVYDQDDERDGRVSVTKAVGVVVTFVFGVLASVGFFTLCVYLGLNALGVDVSTTDALIASASFIALRYFDLGITSNFRKRNQD